MLNRIFRTETAFAAWAANGAHVLCLYDMSLSDVKTIIIRELLNVMFKATAFLQTGALTFAQKETESMISIISSGMDTA